MRVTRTTRSVWIIARPLSASSFLPGLGKTSTGKFYLCHWAVFIGDSKMVEDLNSVVTSERYESHEDVVVGRLFELHRIGSYNTANSRQIRSACFREEWSRFAVHYIGKTIMSDDEVSIEGRYLQHGSNN